MEIITDNSACHSILKPIPPEWESSRRKVASQAGRHAIIAGGAIRDHILGLPIKDIDIFVLGKDPSRLLGQADFWLKKLFNTMFR